MKRRSSSSALDREIADLSRRLRVLKIQRAREERRKRARASLPPPPVVRRESVDRRVLRTLSQARRGRPLLEAVRANGTTIGAVRRRVPGLQRTIEGAWLVPATDSRARRIQILTSGGRFTTVSLSLEEARKYSAYLDALKTVIHAVNGHGLKSRTAKEALESYRLKHGSFITTLSGKRIRLVLNVERLWANLQKPGVRELLDEGPYPEDV